MPRRLAGEGSSGHSRAGIDYPQGGVARHGSRRAGRWPVQLRLATQGITGADYVSSRLWERARLACCPLHPQGGCGFAAHGTYGRVDPPGTRIRRWYCRSAGVTFSALPDCLCARLSGTVQALEGAVRLVEAAPSLAAAVRDERREIEWPGVLRFFRRRVRHTHRALRAIKGLYPDPFAAVLPTLTQFAGALGIEPLGIEPVGCESVGGESVLVRLREMAARHLAALPAPLGFDPVRTSARQRPDTRQHRTGPDPPVVLVEPPGSPGNRPWGAHQPEDADR